MYSYLVKHRREYLTDYINQNRPISLKAVSAALHKARDTDIKLYKAVSADPRMCYETTAKDLQKLRAEGVVSYDAVVFPSGSHRPKKKKVA